MTVSLSNQPQIPVIAPGYWATNKHVWEGQWLHMDTQKQETGEETQSAVLMSVWNQYLFLDYGKKLVVVCLTEI